MKTGIGQFKVGDNTYKYDELAPMEALRFGTQCAKVLGPAVTSLADSLTSVGAGATVGTMLEKIAPALASIDEDKLESLFRTAFAHVFTPQNDWLGDEAAFNRWFMEHKNELFTVGVTALYYLARDFFPNLPATPLGSYQK